MPRPRRMARRTDNFGAGGARQVQFRSPRGNNGWGHLEPCSHIPSGCHNDRWLGPSGQRELPAGRLIGIPDQLQWDCRALVSPAAAACHAHNIGTLSNVRERGTKYQASTPQGFSSWHMCWIGTCACTRHHDGWPAGCGAGCIGCIDPSRLGAARPCLRGANPWTAKTAIVHCLRARARAR